MRFAFSGVAALASAVAAVVVLVAPAAAQSADWQAGPGAAGDPSYTGFIDAPRSGATVPGSGSFSVSGWFVDKTAQGWAGADDVQVWLGTMDGGGRMLAKAQFAQNRPDVAAALGNPYWAASGFSAVVGGIPGGSQTLNVYAHTPAKGWWFKGVTVNGGGPAGSAGAAPPASGGSSTGAPVLKITAPVVGADVSTKNGDFTITGTVDNPGNVDRIEIWINGERNAGGAAELGTTTPLSDGSWSLVFRPTKFPSTHSNIYVYAHNRNGQETLLPRGFNIIDR
jgi:hypothetical protein